MKTPLLLALISAALTLGAAIGPLPDDLAPIGLCALLAALAISALQIRRGPRASLRAKSDKVIAVDGSNLLYWQGETPSLDTVAKILRQLEANGRTPKIWFDANAGYLVANRYLRAEELARMLKIDKANVIVAAKGEPADPLILAAAKRHGWPVLSNDRYRDWHEAFPFITEEGRLLRGRLQDGVLRLDPAFAPRPAAQPKPSALSGPGERRPTAARRRPAATGQRTRRREPRL